MSEEDYHVHQNALDRYNSLLEFLNRAENRVIFLKSQLEKANSEVRTTKKELHLAYDELKRAGRKLASWQEYYKKCQNLIQDVLIDVLIFLHPTQMGESREVSLWWNSVIMDHKNTIPCPPTYPRETKTAHAFFLEEYRKNPFASLTDIRHQAYQAWSKMIDKSRWEQMALDDIERYVKEKGAYEDYQKRVQEFRKEQNEKISYRSISK